MKILITGGTGLIGGALISRLLSEAHEVNVLSRSGKGIKGVKVFQWDLEKQWIEEGAFENVEAIVHLAGEGIADKRWTDKRKKEIIQSRIKPVELIEKYVHENRLNISTLVSASAIGYYGGDTGEDIMTENARAGHDFLADCTVKWEKASEEFTKENHIRYVKIRTGIVLSREGGVLPEMMQPVRLGFGSPLGSGKQWMSWIHIDDLVELYFQALTNHKMKGAYNGVAPNPATNGRLIHEIAYYLDKKLWMPSVPSFVLKGLLGEMSILVLGSSYVKSRRIAQEEIMKFKYTHLNEALGDLIK